MRRERFFTWQRCVRRVRRRTTDRWGRVLHAKGGALSSALSGWGEMVATRERPRHRNMGRRRQVPPRRCDHWVRNLALLSGGIRRFWVS